MVIDTSIIIEHLRAKDKSATILFKLPEEDLFISTVTLFELIQERQRRISKKV